ncbi:MAG: hypothetical protein AAFU80_18045 [Pseudomonadota bacterium]
MKDVKVVVSELGSTVVASEMLSATVQSAFADGSASRLGGIGPSVDAGNECSYHPEKFKGAGL